MKKYRLLNTKKGAKRAGMRNLCKTCRQRPVAVNYYKEGQPYYRSKCDHCARGLDVGIAKWALAGYKKKTTCDKCGFGSRVTEQFDVFHIDGDLNNCKFTNLKTVCANCQRLLHREGIRWKQGDLKPDF
jgi:hypothetical protein